MKTITGLSALCAAALLTLTGCVSEETGHGAAETVAGEITVPAVEPGNAATAVSTGFIPRTEIIDGQAYVVETTSGYREPEDTALTINGVPEDWEIRLAFEEGRSPVISENTDFLTLDVIYQGSSSARSCYYTGEEYRIERFENNEWTEIPFAEERYWCEPAYEVSYYSRPKFDIMLSDDLYAVPLTVGRYRVVKNIGGRDFCAEFDIAESIDDTPMVIEEENGSVLLTINNIKDDRFECGLTFPLPNTYYVMCDTEQYPDLCVGDNIEVDFSVMYRLSERYYRIEPVSVVYSPPIPVPTNADGSPGTVPAAKPVIYLYPEKTADVSVKLDFNGKLTQSVPGYGDGWNVTAQPDGTLICEDAEYPYLFWEGIGTFTPDTSRGFCVSGADTESFLAEKLAMLGLNESESGEFMDYWLPLMRDNPYNVITFAGADYTDNAELAITPAPDTVIRVFMVFRPSGEYVDIPAQELPETPVRRGFTAVEWGGAIPQY